MFRGKWLKGTALGLLGLFSVAYFGERIADRLTTTRIDNSSLALNYTYSSSPEFKENDCRQSLESTLASGFFDDSYLNEVLKEVSFECKTNFGADIRSVFSKTTMSLLAQYIQADRLVLCFIKNRYHRSSYNDCVDDIRTDWAHEIFHDYWNKRLGLKEKNEIQDIAAVLTKKGEKIQEEISDKLGCFDNYDNCPANFFKNKPLTKGQFTSLVHFSSHEYFYRNYYGEDFDIEYYSDEAFAHLLQVVFLKYLDLKEEFYLKDPTKQASLDDKAFAKKAREIFKDNIPEEIRPFYKGLVDPRFFD